MGKLGIAIAVVVLGGGALGGVYMAGKRAGAAERDTAHALALAEWHAREANLVAQVTKARQAEKIKVVYRDRIKTIEAAVGECLDAAVPAAIVDSLR